MILEAFQAAIVRNADGLLYIVIVWASLMAALSLTVGADIVRRRGGHQPSSVGERPEPPRSVSGVQPPVDHSARIARLRAELVDLLYAARGGDATESNPVLLRFIADRLVEVHGENPSVDFVRALRTRAAMIEIALKNARDTLEATKP